MATLPSIAGDLHLSRRLVGKSYGPFQVDLEWFADELAIEGRRQSGDAPVLEPPAITPALSVERREMRGQVNRQDLIALLRGLDELLERSRELRYEPYDLNFHFHWSRETSHIYLMMIWFDLGLAPRRFDQRFPTAPPRRYRGCRRVSSTPATINAAPMPCRGTGASPRIGQATSMATTGMTQE
jgi:hypothetical protein